MILTPRPRRKTRIGLVAGGLGTYRPQFPHLLPQLRESVRYVSERADHRAATSLLGIELRQVSSAG